MKMPTAREIRRVLRAQCGDREALDGLFRDVQQPLFRCLEGILGDPTLAEDVLQDVFVLIHRKLGSLREPELFLAWAYRIATREAFRALKKRKRWSGRIRDDVLPDQTPAPAPTRLDEAELRRLHGMVDAVPPASRAVITLHYLEELPLRDVADVLGVSLGTVKSRLSYGLGKLRSYGGRKT